MNDKLKNMKLDDDELEKVGGGTGGTGSTGKSEDTDRVTCMCGCTFRLGLGEDSGDCPDCGKTVYRSGAVKAAGKKML